jgi:ABC-type sugar transport system ATPase subunit
MRRHDRVEAVIVAERIAVKNPRRIERIGTPLELYDRPADTTGRALSSPTYA